MTTVEYLMTLTPEQAADAVKAMSPEAKQALVGEICGAVGTMARDIVQNADEIWENR